MGSVFQDADHRIHAVVPSRRFSAREHVRQIRSRLVTGAQLVLDSVAVTMPALHLFAP